jgi:hypothetical protein
MFGPFESIVLGMVGVVLAVGVITWGVWALRFGTKAASDDGPLS